MLRRIGEKGSMMVEAIAMLALISLVTPILYKKAAERTTELQDINSAGEIRSVVKAVDDYLKDNYDNIVNGLTVTRDAKNSAYDSQDYSGLFNSSTSYFEAEQEIEDGVGHLSEYLPYGFLDENGNPQSTKLFSGYKIVIKKVDSGPGANKKVLTGFVVAYPKEGDKFPIIRASRIASMVGANGGYSQTDNVISGVQNIWSVADADAELGIDDITKGALVASSVRGIEEAGGGNDSDEYLHRTSNSGNLVNNTMETNMFMGKFNIQDINQLVIEADGPANRFATANEEDDALLIRRGGANVVGRIVAAGEKFNVDADKLSYENMTGTAGTKLNVEDDNFGLSAIDGTDSSSIAADASKVTVQSTKNVEVLGPNGSSITMNNPGTGLLTKLYAPNALVLEKSSTPGEISNLTMDTAGTKIRDEKSLTATVGYGSGEMSYIDFSNAQASISADKSVHIGKVPYNSQYSSIDLTEGGDMYNVASNLYSVSSPSIGLETGAFGGTSWLGLAGDQATMHSGERVDVSMPTGGFVADATLGTGGLGLTTVSNTNDVDIIAGNKLKLQSKDFELAVSDDLILSGDDGKAKLALQKSMHRAIMRYDDSVQGTTGYVYADTSGAGVFGKQAVLAGGLDASNKTTSSVTASGGKVEIAALGTTAANPTVVEINKNIPNENYTGKVTIRQGVIEIDGDSSTNKDDPRSYVKADRFISNVSLGAAAIPHDTGTKYDAFQVNPAYTSVMHDIKLISRGGARLSDILPDFINKGIYVVNNTYREDIGNWEGFSVSGGSVSKTECSGSCATSAWLGFVPAPLCPPGYARVITLAPAGFAMAQAGRYYFDSGNHIEILEVSDPGAAGSGPFDVDPGPMPLYFQKNTWLRARVYPYGSGDGFQGWHAIMGFMYPYKTFKEYMNRTGSAPAIGGSITEDNAIVWNLFPVKAKTLEAYATVYCYFDRLDGSYNEWDVDKYDQMGNFKTRDAAKSTNYKERLNDPRLNYNSPW